MHGSNSRLCEIRQTEPTFPAFERVGVVGGAPSEWAGGNAARSRSRRPPRAEGSAEHVEQPYEDEVANLVKAAAGGDRGAWNALVDRFSPSVWAIARGHRLGYADAADVCQTTWLRLVEHLDRIQQPERVGAWLATTARRESLRVIRMALRQVPTGDELDDIPDSSPPETDRDNLASRHVGPVLERLVSQLPVRSQLLLRLLLAETPMSYRDISEALDMPIGSIGPTRARALEQLRRRAQVAGVDLRELWAV